jgi:hypothetical protein
VPRSTAMSRPMKLFAMVSRSLVSHTQGYGETPHRPSRKA